jgi:hypothetical protein
MTLRVGTLRAASVLFAVFGCCTQRHIVLYLLFCVLRTQHAASLHASISTCPYTNMSTCSHIHMSIYQYPHIPTCLSYSLYTEGRDAACSVRFVSYGQMLHAESHCIVSVVLCFTDAARCVPTCPHINMALFPHTHML